MTVPGIDAVERSIHRIGGASVANLRLKPREATLAIPGFSVLKCATPQAASRQLRAAFPKARGLHADAQVVASTSEVLIRSVGFDIIPVRSEALPNHHRIIHLLGAAGFTDDNLALLSSVFLESTGQ